MSTINPGTEVIGQVVTHSGTHSFYGNLHKISDHLQPADKNRLMTGRAR